MAAHPKEGEYYYGPHCKKCRAFIPRIIDDEHGVGKPVRIEGAPMRIKCPQCGHVELYSTRGLTRQRW